MKKKQTKNNQMQVAASPNLGRLGLGGQTDSKVTSKVHARRKKHFKADISSTSLADKVTISHLDCEDLGWVAKR